MQIQEATIEHLKDILELNQMLFNHEFESFDDTLDCSWPPNNENYFKDSITDPESLALVVIENKVTGYLIARITKAEGYRSLTKIAEIETMFLLPECRGKGIGSKLCQMFLEWAKGKATRARVIASADNKEAIGCYRKNGFIDHNLTLERDL